MPPPHPSPPLGAREPVTSYMLSIKVALGFAPTGVIGRWQKRLSA